MEKYNPQKVEEKWQKFWEGKNFFKAVDNSKKKKFYLLVEFPYPSGSGLHVGHCRSYVGLDVIARKKRMEGFNVLFPMGWDAFGLPTENRAIKTGLHPAEVTKNNTTNFKRQEKRLGLSFDWSREINTTDPDYYKWTQWIFLQMFKKGLAYKAKMPINWCPSCKIGLANEEVINGKCERCGTEVIRKEKEQWMLKITDYADRLIDDLKNVDYPERVKTSQIEWIGRSEGANIVFQIKDSEEKIIVFTTRADTLFGCSYIVLAPEHPLIERLKAKIENYKLVEKYIGKAKKKAERERKIANKEKSGIELKGIKAINPANGRELPVFVADYVLLSYGTGAVMAVPAHDQRDFEFAKKYNLPIIEVIKPEEEEMKKTFLGLKNGAYEGEGVLVNSGRFDGLNSLRARKRIVEWLSKKKLAEKVVNYKLRDWVFSRQRYWGEPIPIVYCRHCWEKENLQAKKDKLQEGKDYVIIEGREYKVVPVPEKELPVELPETKNYFPTEKGDSPLAKIKDWVEVKCPVCGGLAKRETDVMPNWAGSNWYYLRYCDPKNKKELAKKRLLKYWMPVDWYNGGMEHTTLHLLYSRFVYKFLWDIGAVPKEIGPEPYKKRTSHGVVLAAGGEKMSKSKGNVVNPDDVIKEYGADTLRVYEMFMGPFEQAIPWDTKGVKGARRFLEKVWKMKEKVIKGKEKDISLLSLVNETIKRVSNDIETLKFNTAISSLMTLANEMDKREKITIDSYATFLVLLNPFAPHITEEIWQKIGLKGYCFQQKWPKIRNVKLLEKEKKQLIIIEINGKVRDKIMVKPDISEEEAKEIALSREKIKKWLKGKKVKMIIFVPNKLINIVI